MITNKLKKSLILLFTCLFVVGGVFFTSSFNGYNKIKVNASEQNLYENENVQTYQTDMGTRKVYWAKGLNAPKMTADPNLLGTDGYFTKDLSVSPSRTDIAYKAPFLPGNGYYDLNKNRARQEGPHCYLGSSANLLLWWLEQNKQYIDIYRERLKTTDIYGQEPGLINIYPYNDATWQSLYSEPGTEIIDGRYLAQKLGCTDIVTKFLTPYYLKSDDGYFMDIVMDFFINGYNAFSPNNPPHNEEQQYVKDSRGGLFFPIFQNKRLTKKMAGGEYNSYDFWNKNMRRFFAEGKAMSLAYPIGNNAHAITLWGAEYDENDNLCRIFITDTDDGEYSNYASQDDEYLIGLTSYDFRADENGRATFTTQQGKNVKGSFIQEITTLSLAQDIWEEKLADTTNPDAPLIKEHTKNSVVPLNFNKKLSVKAETSDSGMITYEWYKALNVGEKGIKIQDSLLADLFIDTSQISTHYYYCNVVNHKNGKRTITQSPYIQIDVQDIPAVNAQTPKINFNYNTKYCNQYDNIQLKVTATVQDGGELSYQWYQSYDNSSRGGNKLIGETNSVFYPDTSVASRRFYYCVVTNTNYGENITGSNVVSVATPYSKRVEVQEIELVDAKSPVIQKQPLSSEYFVGDVATDLSVVAKSTDKGILSYQWYILNDDGSKTIIDNAISSVYVPDISKPGQTKYVCVVTNTNNNASNNKTCSLISDTAIIKVKEIIVLSGDNNIKSLTCNNGALNPQFNENITTYTLNVHVNVVSLNFNIIVADKANYEILNNNLVAGAVTDVVIKVTAENGAVKNYTIKVTRGSEHSFCDWVVIKEATCTENGLERRTCSVCGEVEEREITAKGHNFSDDWTIDVEPTCTKTGSKSHHCLNCDAKKDISVIPALGHSFGDWVVVKEATTTETGIEERVCSVCGEKESRIIDKLPETSEDSSSDNSSSGDVVTDESVPDIDSSGNIKPDSSSGSSSDGNSENDNSDVLPDNNSSSENDIDSNINSNSSNDDVVGCFGSVTDNIIPPTFAILIALVAITIIKKKINN